MIEELQFLNAILTSKDATLLKKYGIQQEHFIIFRDVYDFIVEYKSKFRELPSLDLILSKFKDFDKVEIDNLEYVSAQLKKQRLGNVIKPFIEKGSDIFNEQGFEDALNYFMYESKNLKKGFESVKKYPSWVKDADIRLDKFIENSKLSLNEKGISTGFPALDKIFNGGIKKKDLVVIFARLKNGKSWVGERMVLEAFIKNHSPILFSLEMDDMSTGYRLDTLYRNFSNKGLICGDSENVSVEGYNDYINNLKVQNRKLWIFTNQQNGKRKWTVKDIRSIAEELECGMIAIDQLSLLGWDRDFKSPTLAFHHICDELKTLAMDLDIPVILLAQAGRQVLAKLREDKNAMPENEDLQWADAIMQYADKGISVRKQDDIIKMKVTANRGGTEGQNLYFKWYFDKGIIEDYDPSTARM